MKRATWLAMALLAAPISFAHADDATRDAKESAEHAKDVTKDQADAKAGKMKAHAEAEKDRTKAHAEAKADEAKADAKAAKDDAKADAKAVKKAAKHHKVKAGTMSDHATKTTIEGGERTERKTSTTVIDPAHPDPTATTK